MESHPSVNIYLGWLYSYGNIEDAKRAAEKAGFSPDDPQWGVALQSIVNAAQGPPN
jgi:hypothetical protein